MAGVREQPAHTNLARVRQRAGLTQQQLAKLSGLSLANLRRLERGELPNPPIRYLSNLALVLDVPLGEICEPEWLGWSRLAGVGSKPPSRQLVEQVRDGKLKLE